MEGSGCLRPRPASEIVSTFDDVEHGATYRVTLSDGSVGRVRAEVAEEWTEVHPRTVVFIAIDNLPPGNAIFRSIFKVKA